MRSRIWFFVLSLALAAGCLCASQADGKQGCPITKAPGHPFVPPPPFSSARLGSGEFFYGTPALWAMVEPDWQVHGFAGQKLPYFRQGYEALKEQDPRLTVVAKRPDGPEQMVWAGPANGAGTNIGSFMVTGLTIPTAGCWKIAAHYTPPAPDKIQTLTYTVWVEP